jgi:hypothetical protein
MWKIFILKILKIQRIFSSYWVAKYPHVLGETLIKPCALRMVNLVSDVKGGTLFGPKRDEVTGGWSKLHDEELHNLYSSPSIIRMIKSRRMRWAGHIAQMGEKGNAYRKETTGKTKAYVGGQY